MKKALGVIPVIAAILLAVGYQSANAQVAETARGISVTGTAEVRAMPDIAYVTLGVRTRNPQADRAASENAATTTKVTQAIRQLGIEEADIETVQYTLQPVFEYPQSGRPRLTGYEATNFVKVTVRNLAQVGRVIDAGVAAGANVVQDVSFALRDESAVRATAITRAVQDGRAKATVMARALDVQLGRLLSASESVSPIVYPMFARAEAVGGQPDTPISPQQIVVRVTVNLVYAVGQ